MRATAIPNWDAFDPAISGFFRRELTPNSAHWLEALTSLGAAPCITAIILGLITYFGWRRAWRSLVVLMLTVPVGAALGEAIKLLVRRNRPFVDGPMGVWGGYSFPSGHTMIATLTYGFLALFLLPMFSRRRWQALVILCAAALIAGVGFSRIALTAHYLTDVLAAIVMGSFWTLLSRFAGTRIGRVRSDQPQSVPVPVERSDSFRD